MPYDFFNCMSKGSGQDLNWFWKRWFFEQGVPDQAITKVNSQNGLHTITISNIGSKPVPVDLNITFTDGSTRKFHKSVACWKKGEKTNSVKFQSNKKIKSIELGNGYDPDVNKENNFWEAK
jgi:aminopeptidase N